MDFEKEIKPVSQSILIKIFQIFAGIIISLVISRLFFFQAYMVRDNSMLPNLEIGDRILVLKIITPVAGDIILFKSKLEPDKISLKRLIAKGGDSIEIKNRKIYKNGKSVKISWPIKSNDDRLFPQEFSGRDNFSAASLKNDEVFVMGDNLDYSFDSRNYGPVSADSIIGWVILKY